MDAWPRFLLAAGRVAALDFSTGLWKTYSSAYTPLNQWCNGVALFDGAAWKSYNHGSSFLPFYAPGEVQFDSDGHLWIAVLNFGAVKVLIGDDPKPAIPGDITGDGAVNANDLLAVLNAWGPCPSKGACPADISPTPDGDGLVNANDLLMVINNWSL